MNNDLPVLKMRSGLRSVVLMLVALLVTACAKFAAVPPPPAMQIAEKPVAKSVVKVSDGLPPLDAVMVAHHRQCESPGSGVAVSDDVRQLRELMDWLKRNCAISDANLATQLASLKLLRAGYTWPEPYAAWLDEWRRQLVRLLVWQQRAVAAEAEQATMVKRLREIERDLISRP